MVRSVSRSPSASAIWPPLRAPGPFDDRVHQVSLVLEHRGEAAEVLLLRVFGNRFAQRLDLGVQIGLAVQPSLHVGDVCRELLALLLLDVELND